MSEILESVLVVLISLYVVIGIAIFERIWSQLGKPGGGFVGLVTKFLVCSLFWLPLALVIGLMEMWQELR